MPRRSGRGGIAFADETFEIRLPTANGNAIISTMNIRKAVRYRLEPSPEQENLLNRAVGCVRFVWNRALSIQKSYLERLHYHE